MRKSVQRDTPFKQAPHPATIPVMLPIGNLTPHTEESVRSLLEQDYNAYRVILITAEEDEDAAVLITRLCEEYGHATHVVAGIATHCSQKNHNLLAAIATLQPEEDILVFCDSTHTARSDFLARLITPIIKRDAVMTSGYRFVRPGDSNMGTLFQMLAVQSIHMLYSIKIISQPWGGATAIARSTFLNHQIPSLWSRTLSDDYSLGPYLQTQGIRSLPIAEACLETHLEGQSVKNAANWFYRQLHIFKFYTPFTWIAASLAPLFYLCMLAYAGLALIMPPTPTATVVTLAYITSMCFIGLWYTRIIPNNAPIPKRIILFFIFNILSAIQLLRTWTSNTISWQNIDYRMKMGGEVAEIIRHDGHQKK